jgi:serine/threonine protein kinase
VLVFAKGAAPAAPDLRLCDFGSSHALPDAPDAPDAPWAYTWAPFSTPAYAAPEVFQGRYGLPSDLYSFGQLVLALADAHHAATDSAAAALRRRAALFLHPDPARRPTVQDALAMDWDA